ncbi:MAG: hypothetical protein KatS3mg102_0717 [Planctomycetota bacterium]|nr:MAG: hypothetical protein KatS3mg102_0717 [Planctomycetota bacterium]
MNSFPPEASAFALAQRNFDAIEAEDRDAWYDAFRKASRRALPWPERFIVELANTCNLDCPMCRVGRFGVDLRRIMPLATFERLACELLSHAREVRLNGLGESTLVPEFERYLDVLAQYPVSVELITNGTGPLAIYERMVADGATLLFSWDAADPAVFEVLRRPARFAALQARAQAVGAYAKRLDRSDNLHLLFTLQSLNVDQLAPVVELAHAMGFPNVVVNVAKLPSMAWLERVAERAIAEFSNAEQTARQLGVRLFLPDRLGSRAIKLASACRTSASGCDRPWREVVIRWNLDVQACNMFNPYTYGNLHLRSFHDIWCGAFAAAFRKTLNGPHCHPYCRGCAYVGEVYDRKNR